MSIARHVLEMFDLLQDAAYKSGLPSVNRKCAPICTKATQEYCLLGFNPKDSAYELDKYVIDSYQWSYELIADLFSKNLCLIFFCVSFVYLTLPSILNTKT